MYFDTSSRPKHVASIWIIVLKYFFQVTFDISLSQVEFIFNKSQNIQSKILSNENKKTGVSRTIVCYGILMAF